MGKPREQRLGEVLASLADTLVADYGGRPVTCSDLSREAGRWPTFGAHTYERGYRSVHTRPMRVRATVIGALDLFGDQVGAVPEIDELTRPQRGWISPIGAKPSWGVSM